MKKTPPDVLFWSKVDRSGECWLWLAATDADGYGKFAVTLPRDGVPLGAKTPQRHPRAHHFAWEMVNGPVPRGVYLLHSCDTPACVNPAHLRLGNAADNHSDAKTKGRHSHGERHGMAKLTTEDVLAIRASSERGVVLARRYGVGNGTISAVRTGRIWRHVERPATQRWHSDAPEGSAK